MKTKGQLNKEEKSEFGDVKGFVYSFYIRNCGICNSVILVLFYLSFIGLKIFSGLWVSYWFSDQFDFKNENWYPIIYLIVIFLAAVSLILRSLSYGHTVSTGSYNLFDSVVTNILRRPLSFFDTTPSGQIMNRCVKDVSDIDFRLPFMFSFFINNFFTIIGSMILLSVISPIHLILILIVFYFVGVTIYKFNKIQVELQRMEKLAISPALSGLAEMVNGITSIRAYQKLEFMKKKLIKRLNLQVNTSLVSRIAGGWSRVRVELSITFLIIAAVWFVAIGKTVR